MFPIAHYHHHALARVVPWCHVTIRWLIKWRISQATASGTLKRKWTTRTSCTSSTVVHFRLILLYVGEFILKKKISKSGKILPFILFERTVAARNEERHARHGVQTRLIKIYRSWHRFAQRCGAAAVSLAASSTSRWNNQPTVEPPAQTQDQCWSANSSAIIEV